MDYPIGTLPGLLGLTQNNKFSIFNGIRNKAMIIHDIYVHIFLIIKENNYTYTYLYNVIDRHPRKKHGSIFFAWKT